MMNFMERLKLRKRAEYESRYYDYSILFAVFFLVGFGLLMIYSASSYEANLATGDSAYYLKRQAIAAGIGIVGMFAVSFIPYKLWNNINSAVYFIIPVVLLFLLLIPGISVTANGATRWIKLVGGFNLQPAEVAKVCMILFYAKYLTVYNKFTKDWLGLLKLMIPGAVICILIFFISDNLSSAIIVAGIIVCMTFVATQDWKKITLALGGFAGLAALIIFLILQFSSDDSSSFRYRRIFAWIHPENYADNVGFQTLQSLYAIGSGGIFGKGLGQSMQKLSYIPEAQNDMIFSIICEELGIFGALFVITLFLILIWRFFITANNTSNMFGALIVVGVMFHFAIQVILNIAVVTNTIPNTGISLPFISYGGSSILFLLMEVGIVLNVASNIKLRD